MREKMKKVERENVEFRQRGYRNSFAQFCCPGGCLKCECAQGKPNDVEKKNLAIVAMPLPKMGGKKK